MYITVSLMIIIGMFPFVFIDALQRPVNLFTHDVVFNMNLIKVGAIDSLRIINWLFFGLILFVLLIIGIRKYFTNRKLIETGPTWGCAYAPAPVKFQYSAGSYVRSFTKLAKPVLEIEKKNVDIPEVFPGDKHYETDPYDKIERIFIDKPLALLNIVSDQFLFLQNGQLQQYILYGIIFITSVICLPVIIDKFILLLHFLNNL
jgi:hypothetical protein